jgi:hypothetical protein
VVYEIKEVAKKSRQMCCSGNVRLKKKVNEKSGAKTNSTHNVKVIGDKCQDDNGDWETTTNRRKRLIKEC